MQSMDLPEDRTVIRYLLGTLEDSEAERIEEQYFLDSSFEEHIGAVEDSLIADFLDGMLSPGDLQLFESKYLRVPELREKVAFARRLRTATSSGHKAGSAQLHPRPWRLSFAAVLPPVFALIGLVCLAISWILFHKGLDYRKPQVLPPKNAETQSASTSSLEPLLSAPTASVVLVPGVTKGVNSKPVRLLLTPDINEVRLQLDMAGTHEELLARVEILLVLSASRKPVWSVDGIPSVPTASGRTVLVSMKPDDLISGDYVAYVKDSSHGTASEPLQSYIFSVVRP